MGSDAHLMQGRIARITRTSRYIVAAIALVYVARLVIASRRIGSCEELAGSNYGQGGLASAAASHVWDQAQIEAALDQTTSTYGRPYNLVNATAANPYFGLAADTLLDAFQKIVEVNFRGASYCLTARAARRTQSTDWGVIVNFASIAGLVHVPNQRL